MAVISGKLYINKSGVKIPTDAMVSETYVNTWLKIDL
jgi:hypothetical protein